MNKFRNSQQLSSLFIPLFLMTLFLFPLLFILIKRYFSLDIISFSLVNSLIMTSGMLLNLFIMVQLSNRIKKRYIYFLILITSAGFSISGFIYVLIKHSLFFIYGMDVILSYIFIVFIIIFSLSLFCSLFFNYQRIISQERRIREKETRLREEMERQIYSSKVNPHFLFNSLNLMVSLLDNKEKAEDVLISLSELLRYNIDASRKEIIPVKEELESVEKYFFIQKERFGKRLDYEIVGKSGMSMPPLLLQPLVENSIKHNLDRSNYIKVTIIIKESSNGLLLRIYDSEYGLKDEMIGLGTGLEVTKKRVELVKGTFKIEDGGIIICLPLK